MKSIVLKLSFHFLTTILVLSGCLHNASGEIDYSRIHISPDGNWITYLRGQIVFMYFGPEPFPIRQSIEVCWSNINSLKKQNIIKLAEWGWSKIGETMLSKAHIKISPDSQFLSIIIPEQIVILELATGKKWSYKIEKEIICSYNWLEHGHFHYSTYKKIDKHDDSKYIRTFWKQNIHKPIKDRIIIYQDKAAIEHYVYDGMDWPVEYWSPDGNYVLFKGPDRIRRPHLLDLSANNVTTLGNEKESLSIASWSPDASKLVYTIYSISNQKYESFLFNLVSKETSNITENMQMIFKSSSPSYEPIWTPTGDFIVGFNLDKGGYIFCPKPWEFRELGKSIERKMNLKGPIPIRIQQAKNMLLANTVEGEILIDYTGKIIKRLEGNDMSGWSVSPDGKKAVMVESNGKLRIIELK